MNLCLLCLKDCCQRCAKALLIVNMKARRKFALRADGSRSLHMSRLGAVAWQ
jgi:hypothetical protein